MTALLAAAADETPLGRRDRAILELFYASGLRLSEVAGLDLEDVNLGARMARVLGKGGKQRLVPFNTSTATAIRAYLKGRETLVRGRKGGIGRSGRNAGSGLKADPSRPALPRESVVRELSRGPADRAEHRSAGASLRRGVERAQRHQSSCAASFLRDAPAAARRRPPRHSGAARPRAPEHDRALHARQRRAAPRGVPQVPPPGEDPPAANHEAEFEPRIPASDRDRRSTRRPLRRAPAARRGARAGTRCRAS